MKIEVGKTYKTRDGKHTVRVIAIDVEDDQPVVGVLSERGGSESVHQFSTDGSFYTDCSDGLDLVSEVLPTCTVYLNVYAGGRVVAHKDEAKARRFAASRVVHIAYPVEIPFA